MSNSFHTKVEGQRMSPGYVLHFCFAMAVRFLRTTVAEGESSKEKRSMFDRSKLVKLAITASVSCRTSPGNSSTAASDASVFTDETAGARMLSSTSILSVSFGYSLSVLRQVGFE